MKFNFNCFFQPTIIFSLWLLAGTGISSVASEYNSNYHKWQNWNPAAPMQMEEAPHDEDGSHMVIVKSVDLSGQFPDISDHFDTTPSTPPPPRWTPKRETLTLSNHGSTGHRFQTAPRIPSRISSTIPPLKFEHKNGNSFIYFAPPPLPVLHVNPNFVSQSEMSLERQKQLADLIEKDKRDRMRQARREKMMAAAAIQQEKNRETKKKSMSEKMVDNFSHVCSFLLQTLSKRICPTVQVDPADIF